MSSVAERLVGCGFEADAAASRAAMLERAAAAQIAVAGAAPVWRWIVPGRIEVFGKHTDYAGGRSLVSAVPRGFAVVARPRDDDLVRVIDVGSGESTTVDRSGCARPRRGWATYISTVVRRLADNFPGRPLGTDIAFVSDLPRAAGLSSSSALLVAVATALVRRGELEAHPAWRAAIGSPFDLAGYFGCIENGQTFRSLAGARGVGTRGGSEDHTAILLGRARTLRQFSYTPVHLEDEVTFPRDWRFVIASSGVHADKAGSVRDRYNRAARSAGVLLSIWNRRTGASAVSLGVGLRGASDGPNRLRAWLRAANADEEAAGFSADDLSRRLEHFIEEDGRVAEAVAAIRAGDVAELGRLAIASQADAERLLGNQVPDTMALVEEAVDVGATAAASFGAGFGGSVWAVVPADEALAFGERWMTSYRERCPGLPKSEWFDGVPAPPLVEVAGSA
ncbi:MAG: galactokinase [Acidobacteria bacterium]|nr:galactokinase [Acidobacteriota bacterium]